MERKFEITIQTDVNDPYEPNEKELREFLQLCLSPRKYQLSDHFVNFTVKANESDLSPMQGKDR